MLISSEDLWVVAKNGGLLDLKRIEGIFTKDPSAFIPPGLVFGIYSDFDLAVGHAESLKNQTNETEHEENSSRESRFEVIPLSAFLSKMVETEWRDGYEDGRREGFDSGYDDGRSDGYDEGRRIGYDSGYDDGSRACDDEKTS